MSPYTTGAITGACTVTTYTVSLAATSAVSKTARCNRRRVPATLNGMIGGSASSRAPQAIHLGVQVQRPCHHRGQRHRDALPASGASSTASLSGGSQPSIVTLSGIADAMRTSTGGGVNGAISTSAAIGFLVGDINGTGRVTAADGAYIKTQSGILKRHQLQGRPERQRKHQLGGHQRSKARAGTVLAPSQNS